MPRNVERKRLGVKTTRMRSGMWKRTMETAVKKEDSLVLPPHPTIAAKMEAAKRAPISENPVKKQEPKITAPVDPPAPCTPQRKHRHINHLSQLHTARLERQSPIRQTIIPPTPSRAARELWKTAKTIQKSLSRKDINEQRRQLRDLRDGAGLAPKDLSGLCDWQIDTEYRTILKGLEKKWLVKRKTLRSNISAWVDNTQREREDLGIDGIDGVDSPPKEKSDISVAGTNAEIETDDNDSSFETIPKSVQIPNHPSLPRTNSGRVRLPIIANPNFAAPQLPAPKPRVHLPIIASFNDPQASRSKARVHLPVIKSYNAPQSPESEEREYHAARRTEVPLLSSPPTIGYNAAAAQPLTPRRNRILLHPTPAREAREVWSEARKRLRRLPNLPIAQQRLELGAMRSAAGFVDQETRHVRDEAVVEVYRAELKVLESKWMGRMDNRNEAFSSSSAVRSGNWEVLGETSGVEADGSVGEDDGDSDFETASDSQPPTPTRKQGKRPVGLGLG